MKILVLGGCGFIGSHVVDSLLLQGHEVRVFDRSADKFRLPIADVRYFYGDFSNTLMLAEALQGADVVVHLISATVPSTSNIDPVSDIKSNLINTVQLLQLIRDAGISRIVYLSSGGTVYGVPRVLPVSENSALNPISSYGIVKVSIESYLALFQHLYGIQSLVLRPSNPYGPRQGHEGVQGVISTFMYRMLRNENIVIWGDGSVIRDYIFIDDLTRLCCLAIESGVTGVFNAGSGVGYTLNNVISEIEFAIGKKANIQYKPSRAFDVPELVLDISNVKNTFDWEPEMPIGKGVLLHKAWLNSLLSIN